MYLFYFFYLVVYFAYVFGFLLLIRISQKSIFNCLFNFSDIKELPSSEAQEFTKLQYSQKVRHYLKDNFKEMDTKNVSLTCADYHKGTHILVTGFSNGSFFIHELPDVNLIHSLR